MVGYPSLTSPMLAYMIQTLYSINSGHYSHKSVSYVLEWGTSNKPDKLLLITSHTGGALEQSPHIPARAIITQYYEC